MRISVILLLCALAACSPLASKTAPPPIHEPTATLPTPPAISTPSPSPSATGRFDGTRAYQQVTIQMQFGDRPVGSAALRKTGDYILARLVATGWASGKEDFFYREVPVRNLWAAKGQGGLLILGAHYDARAKADRDPNFPDRVVPAANDGASGVAVLLELARVLDFSKIRQKVMLMFFDAEDDGELNMCPANSAGCDPSPWPWSVGAEYAAAHLPQAPDAVIILDMVGDRDQNIYFERNSDATLQSELWAVAARLGYAQQFIPQYKYPMLDDHTPFLAHGYRAVDIIDFDYPYYHTLQDTADKVSPASLERIGRVVQTWLQGE